MSRRALRRLFGPKLPAPGALHVCPLCRGDFVNPTYWAKEVAQLWRVGLRCAACGHERETVMGDEIARMFTEALDTRFDTLLMLERERMAAWVDTFAVALERDLIGAADFSPPR